MNSGILAFSPREIQVTTKISSTYAEIGNYYFKLSDLLYLHYVEDYVSFIWNDIALKKYSWLVNFAPADGVFNGCNLSRGMWRVTPVHNSVRKASKCTCMVLFIGVDPVSYRNSSHVWAAWDYL
jgi:hypothetical protein